MRNCYAITLRIFVLLLVFSFVFQEQKSFGVRLLLYQHTDQCYALTQKQKSDLVNENSFLK